MNTSLDRIKAFCYSLGFELVGVTAPEDLSHFSIYEKWIADGCQAGMYYLATERAIHLRRSPRNVMPSCQSVLVLAYPYPAAALQGQSSNRTTPSIAAYARMEDYHVFLPPLLEKIVHFIQIQSNRSIESKAFTDTGPLLERELAYQAGLGWIGKNSCLINPSFGSFFFLSEILLDIPLFDEEKDPQFQPDRCGTCHRCIDICPTRCIQDNRTLDSRKCISYLTIENKGEIPLELRAAIGDHLFGCDLCQQVCPWNQKILASSHTPPLPQVLRKDLEQPNSLNILDEIEFKREFASSPISRAKRSGFYRNLAVVLGNKRDVSDIPLLLQLLRDPDTLVRQHAAWALECFHTIQIQQYLKEAFQDEKDERVIREIQKALEK